jgi:hypothetical protein
MKSLIAIATAILAATTLLTSTAEAGFRVRLFGGVPPYLTDYNKQAAQHHRRARKHYRAARRQRHAPAHVTKKAARTDDVAKVEKKTEAAPAKVAETENSSISVAKSVTKADAKPAAAAAPVKTAAATPNEPQAERKIDCKKFFATVGMTLTVPCE